MHDALVRVAERVQAHAEFAAVLLERRQLRGARLVRVRLVYVDRGRVVVFGGDELVEVPRCATGQAEPLKRLRTGHFVHQHEVDIQQVGSAVAALAHQMIGPNLFGQCHSHKPVPPSVVSCAGRALPCFSRAARLPHASLSVQTKGWRIAGRVLCQNARCEGFFKDVADCFRRIIQNRKHPKIEPMIDGYSGFLFLDKNDMPMVALHWEKHFEWALAKHNRIYKEQLPKITPHVCRHTYCSNMAKSGMNPKTLQYLMGHSDIGVTLNTYTHLGAEDAKEELGKYAKMA